MNDEKVTDLLIDIKTQLAEVVANQKNFASILTNHENRLMKLESKTSESGTDWKSDTIRLLVKCLIVGLTIIGSLTGASGLIKSMTNEKPNQSQVQSN